MERNRYGRHGPHAKRSWRERRYGRRALNVAQETRGAVVPFRESLVDTERIIVMADDDNQDPNKQEHVLLPTTGGSSTESPILLESYSQRKLDPSHFTMVYAGRDAMRQAEKDWEQREIKLDPVDLDRAAEKAWYDCLDKQDVASEASGYDLRSNLNVYVEQYKKEYNHTIYLHDSNLIEAVVTNKLRKKACEDEEEDSAHGKSLSSRHIEYQAVLRVSEQLRFDTRAKSGYLDALDRYVSEYAEAYEKYRSQEEEQSL